MKLLNGKIVKLGVLLFVALLCLTILGMILTGINHFRVGSQLAGINQVSNLSHLLVRQQAKLFSLMLVKNTKNEELIDNLNAFTKEEFVIDASLYNPMGSLIAQSQYSHPFIPLINKKNTMPETQQIVEPIFAQDELIGFLRVTFNSQYGQTTQTKINELFHLLYGELLILFLAGGLFISCFYYFQRRRSILMKIPAKNIEKIATQSQRFHSRRRAFRRN